MAKCAVCSKPSKFKSGRLNAEFCSDEHYEQLQRGDDPGKPHLIMFRAKKTKDGETPAGAFFEQGDIQFPIDTQNLDRVLGAGSYSFEPSCIEKLMDSQVASLAIMNKIPIEPFVRHLVTSPLHGIIQAVWYRDLRKPHDAAHLAANQEVRIAQYIRNLASYVPTEENGERKSRKASAKHWAGTYRVTGKEANVKGREQQVYETLSMLPKSEGTLAQIVEAAKNKVKTKQDMAKIVNRFLKQLVSDGLVQEVKQ